ncbi:hypothetical protein HPB51_022673 [Rhipicephalus microplus]|uniref:Uncharacterized protein n=1 Tax=Rhipicephalus microplus TaxID=6941 RepID=A0A9J6D7A5_RHIMP|nr:hypothetical protein HPB51_022673 [Rhipicephalus microplus]
MVVSTSRRIFSHQILTSSGLPWRQSAELGILGRVSADLVPYMMPDFLVVYSRPTGAPMILTSVEVRAKRMRDSLYDEVLGKILGAVALDTSTRTQNAVSRVVEEDDVKQPDAPHHPIDATEQEVFCSSDDVKKGDDVRKGGVKTNLHNNNDSWYGSVATKDNLISATGARKTKVRVWWVAVPLERGRVKGILQNVEEDGRTEAVRQQWQNEGCGGYRPVTARNLSRLDYRRPRVTSYARRRWCSWSRSRPVGEMASTWIAESGNLRRAGPIYRVFSGVAEHGSAQPPHSEQLSQRRPWCDSNSGTFPNSRRRGDTSDHLDDSGVSG